MDVSAHLYAPATMLLGPIGLQAGWAPEPVFSLEKFYGKKWKC